MNESVYPVNRQATNALPSAVGEDLQERGMPLPVTAQHTADRACKKLTLGGGTAANPDVRAVWRAVAISDDGKDQQWAIRTLARQPVCPRRLGILENGIAGLGGGFAVT